MPMSLLPTCPFCMSDLLVEALGLEAGPEDRVLCLKCGDIGSRRDIQERLGRAAKSSERMMAEALERVLRYHGAQERW